MNYQLLAKSRSGQVGLVTMGESIQDCFNRIPEAIEDWTISDLRDLDEYWVEEWLGTPASGRWRIVDMDYQRYRFSRPIHDRMRRVSKTNFIVKG